MLLVRHLFRNGVGESSIHLVVVFPVRRAKRRTGMRHMTERPQTFIGKAVIVSLLFFRIEPDATERIARIVRRNLQPVMTVYGFSVSISASLRHPGSIAGAKYRLKCRNQTTGWNLNRDSAALPAVNVRLTIGDDKQTAAIQFRADMVGEPFRSPQRFVRI